MYDLFGQLIGISEGLSMTWRDVGRVTNSECAEASALRLWLTAVHYEFFMAKKEFWYSKELQEQDKRLCVLISDMRRNGK